MATIQPPTRVKICGNTQWKDAKLAVESGADALGFIFYRKSPRYISVQKAREIIAQLPPFIETVGVFVNESAERINQVVERCELDAVQLHGDESPAFCKKIRCKVIKAFRIQNAASLAPISKYPVRGILVDAFSPDAYGGTGTTCDWNLVKRAKKFGPVILAGGLTPGNVEEGIKIVRPWAVDVCSGVEKTPGQKDSKKLRLFIQLAKNCQASAWRQ